MLYVITESQSSELDMPVYATHEGSSRDSVVVFTSEETAKLFLANEPNAGSLSVAELRGIAILRLIVKLHESGIHNAIIDARPRGETYAAATSLPVECIIDLASETVIRKMTGRCAESPPVKDTAVNNANAVRCSECGRRVEVAPNETLPLCCGKAMALSGVRDLLHVK